MGNAINKSLLGYILLIAFLAASLEAQAGLPEAIAAYKSKNYKLAVKQFVPLAENGDPVALFYIALMYDTAEGLEENYPQAMMLYRRAADAGYAPAQCNLGVMYETRAGADRSYKDAALWYLKAAAQGYAPAQFNLGVMNLIGRGSEVPRNYKEAESLFTKAAEQGYAPAQNSLARMYEYGLGVHVNLVQAYKWYSLASDAGNEAAKLNKLAVEIKLDPDLLKQSQALAQEWRTRHNK